MIVNSKFSSLFLGKKESWKAPFDQDVCYMQKFAIGEEIRIQFIGYTAGFTAKYVNEKGDEIPVDVKLLYADSGNEGKRLYEIVFSVVTEGVYLFSLTSEKDKATSVFYIGSLDKLKNTVLVTSTHRKDEYDTIFLNPDGTQKLFNFRIEGGFYPGAKVQAVENEIFRDQRFEPHQTAAEAYEISTFTIGTKRGVPGWVGNKINHIFNLSEIYLDERLAVRNESATPELVSIGGNYPMYVFKMQVELSDEEVIYKEGEYLELSTDNLHINGTGDVAFITLESSSRWKIIGGSTAYVSFDKTNGLGGFYQIKITGQAEGYSSYVFENATGERASVFIINTSKTNWILDSGMWDMLGIWYDGGIWNNGN